MNAGSVVVGLGAQVDRKGFEAFDHEIVKAQRVKDINVRLGGEFVDKKEFELYNRKLDETRAKVAKRAAFRASLGADYDSRAFTSYYRETQRVEKANDGVVKANGRLRTSFGAVWGAGGTAFAAVGGAYAVVGAVRAGIKAYGEAEVSQAKMKTQLEALGVSYDAHAKQIDKVIQKTSQLSGLDDEDLQDAFTNIIRTNGNVAESLKLTGLAADLARARQLDVAKAGDIVAKVAGGNTGILKRYGVSVKDGATASEALAAAQAKFSGQAEAYGKTQQGAMDRVSVAFENLEEALGTYLAPTVTKVSNAVAKFINQLQDGTGTGGKVVKIFEQIGDTVQDLSPLWKALGRIVSETVKGVIEQIQGIARIVRGISEIVSGIAHGDWAKAWQGVQDIVGGALKSIVGAIRRFTAPIRVAFGAIWDGIGSAVTGAFRAVEHAVGGVLDKLLGGLTTVTGATEAFLAKLGGISILGKHPFSWAADAAKDIHAMRGELDDARASMRNWGSEADTGAAKTHRLSSRYNDLVDDLKTTTKGSEAYRQKALQVKAAQDDVVRSVAGTGPASSKAAGQVQRLGINFADLGGDVGNAASYIVAATNQVLQGLGADTIKFSLNASKRLAGYTHAQGGYVKADGGWIGQRGERGADNVPIVVGRGEAVLNRHQQGVIEGYLGNGFLDTLFSNVTTPHYHAHGGFVGARAGSMSMPLSMSSMPVALNFAVGGVVDRAPAQSSPSFGITMFAPEIAHYSLEGFNTGGKAGAAVGRAFSSFGSVGSSVGTQGAIATIKPLDKAQTYGAKQYNAIIDKIARVEHRYTIAERVYQRDDSDLIDETTGEINGDAIQQRLGEIDTMITMRRQIESLYEQAVKYAAQVANTIRQIIGRLKASLGGAKGKDRSGIRGQISDYQASLADWTGPGGFLGQARDMVDISQQDVLDRLKERAGIAGTKAEDITASSDLGSSDDSGFDLSDLDFGDYGSSTDSGTATPEQVASGIYDAPQTFNSAQVQTFKQFGSNFVPSGVSIGGGSDVTVNAAGMRYFGAVQGQEAPPSLAGVSHTFVNNFAAPPEDPHKWSSTQRYMIENL